MKRPTHSSLSVTKAGLRSTDVTHTFEAAWVPFTADRTFDEAAEIAIRWADAAVAERGGSVALVTDAIGEYHGNPIFSRFRFRPELHVSPRSGRRPSGKIGAVLAHVPTPKALHLAGQIADGAALVVVEHPSPWRLTGWARATSAVDILTGNPTPALDATLLKRLRDLERYGNNGYPKGFGRDHASRILREMQADDQLDRDLVLSALLANGVLSVNALETLDKLITEVAGRRTYTA
jgi:hypothetical protein